MFHFKQFSVDQSGCAMKINTDGVLLGALTEANNSNNILDIGTGTGVIALMLAQRFIDAQIDAVEIDPIAAKTADNNIKNSPFSDRIDVYSVGFEAFFDQFPEKKYGLIVSNPPFFINSLKPPGAKKELAKHADDAFFSNLIKAVSMHLDPDGVCWLILPMDTSTRVKALAKENSLFIKMIISVYSYPGSQPHREILALTLEGKETYKSRFVIYDLPNKHSEQYQAVLKDFFIIF